MVKIGDRVRLTADFARATVGDGGFRRRWGTVTALVEDRDTVCVTWDDVPNYGTAIPLGFLEVVYDVKEEKKVVYDFPVEFQVGVELRFSRKGAETDLIRLHGWRGWIVGFDGPYVVVRDNQNPPMTGGWFPENLELAVKVVDAMHVGDRVRLQAKCCLRWDLPSEREGTIEEIKEHGYTVRVAWDTGITEDWGVYWLDLAENQIRVGDKVCLTLAGIKQVEHIIADPIGWTGEVISIRDGWATTQDCGCDTGRGHRQWHSLSHFLKKCGPTVSAPPCPFKVGDIVELSASGQKVIKQTSLAPDWQGKVTIVGLFIETVTLRGGMRDIRHSWQPSSLRLAGGLTLGPDESVYTASLKDQVAYLQKVRDEANRQIKAQQALVDVVRSERDQAKGERDYWKDAAEARAKDLMAYPNTVRKQSNEIQDLRKERDAAYAELSEMRTHRESLYAKIEDLVRDRDQWKRMAEANRAYIGEMRLSPSAEALAAKANELRAQRHHAWMQLRELREKYAALEIALKNMTNERDVAQADMRNLRESYDALRASFDLVKTDLGNAQKSLRMSASQLSEAQGRQQIAETKARIARDDANSSREEAEKIKAAADQGMFESWKAACAEAEVWKGRAKRWLEGYNTLRQSLNVLREVQDEGIKDGDCE
jgi:uncharacterized coiled-coil DUF342 family protein